MKRAFDVAVSAIALVVLSPVLVLASVAVATTSRGGILFRQERVGRHARPFWILKLRTMSVSDGLGPQVTVGGDSRITQVGSVLRATKIDELPQLLNVLRGDMALVGPRPEVRRYVDMWPATDKEVILSVRPGITDPASIQFRNESQLLAQQSEPETYYTSVLLPQKVTAYVEYVRDRSFLGDLRILAATAVAVVRR